MRERCAWAKNKLDIEYHDTEWGVPLRNEITLFEFLILEGAQAGLSWITVLKKRQAYREAYDQFDPAIVAKYDTNKIQTLLNNQGLIRNKLKINASVKNAHAFLRVQKEFNGFANYLWGFVNNKPIINHWQKIQQVPSQTEISTKLSKDLKKRGFSFVGPTICYALMQTTGLVNDHLVTCPRHAELTRDI